MQENYHMTENKYLESISNVGLIPQQGIRSGLIGDSKNAIFYSQGYEGVIAMFFMMIERYIEYRGSIGDMHINDYNELLEMANQKQKQGIEISKTLSDAINREKKIVDIINLVRNVTSWKDFLGEGVCLKISNVNEEIIDLPEFTFYNSWTTSNIQPENIYVVTLENKETGEVLTSKYDLINYFISKIPLEKMKMLLYNTESRESKRETHLLWQIMSKYYSENKKYFENYFDKFNIVEIPISNYLSKENNKLI